MTELKHLLPSEQNIKNIVTRMAHHSPFKISDPEK